MKVSTLHALVKSGIYPVVRFTDAIGSSDELIAKAGMIAKVVNVIEHSWDLFYVTFDYSVALEHNLSLRTDNVRNDINQEEIAFDIDQDDGFDLALESGSPIERYLHLQQVDPEFKKTYVEWLEDRYALSMQDTLHPNTEKASQMSNADAQAMMLARVYRVCCVAEKFEPFRFVGNGHHFAQDMSRLVADEFVKRLREVGLKNS